MSISLRQIAELKQRVEELKAAAQRNAGVLQAIMERLKHEYGVDTIAGAQDLLAKKEKELGKLQKDTAAAIEDFEKRFGELVP